jgi:hypothetical protein
MFPKCRSHAWAKWELSMLKRRRHRRLADSIDPKKTSVEAVERVITGMEH